MNPYSRAIDLERQLAVAQGHVVSFVAPSGTVWIRLPDGNVSWMPRPARDVADCMSLMVDVGVWPRERSAGTIGRVFEVVNSDGWICHTEPIAYDDDRKVYFMLAAVAGAIAVLKRRASDVDGKPS